MADLTRTAKMTKVTMITLVIFILSIIGLLIVFDIGKTVYNRLFPKAPSAPTVAFGKLPVLDFSTIPTITNSEELTFKLEVVGDRLPEFGDRSRVFSIKAPVVSFLTLDSFKTKVKRFGFLQDPQPLSETSYKWLDPQITGRELTLDISTGNFTLSYNYFSDQQILQKTSTIDIKESAKAARRLIDFLSSPQQLDSLDRDNATTALFKLESSKLAQAVSLSEANFVRVNILRKEIEKVPFVSAYSDRAPVSILLSGLGGNKQIAEANFYFWNIDFEKNSTYPIKSTVDAFTELKQGKGFVTARFAPTKEIIIYKAYLAYLELPGKHQQYLQPVYVFEGQFNFRAIVPAIQNNYIEAEPESE